jgi:hypothetical protein
MFLQVFQTYVLSVLSAFRHVLQMFHLDVFKSRLGVTHVAMAPVVGGQQLATGLRLLSRALLVRRASPSPLLSLLPFHSIHLAAAVRAHIETEGCGRPCVWAGDGWGESGSMKSERAGRMAHSRSRKWRAAAGIWTDGPGASTSISALM